MLVDLMDAIHEEATTVGINFGWIGEVSGKMTTLKGSTQRRCECLSVFLPYVFTCWMIRRCGDMNARTFLSYSSRIPAIEVCMPEYTIEHLLQRRCQIPVWCSLTCRMVKQWSKAMPEYFALRKVWDGSVEHARRFDNAASEYVGASDFHIGFEWSSNG